MAWCSDSVLCGDRSRFAYVFAGSDRNVGHRFRTGCTKLRLRSSSAVLTRGRKETGVVNVFFRGDVRRMRRHAAGLGSLGASQRPSKHLQRNRCGGQLRAARLPVPIELGLCSLRRAWTPTGREALSSLVLSACGGPGLTGAGRGGRTARNPVRLKNLGRHQIRSQAPAWCRPRPRCSEPT